MRAVAAARSTITLPNNVPLPNVTAGSGIGCSTLLVGDFSFVGACDGGEQAAGVIYTFRAASREMTGVITPPTPLSGMKFGAALAAGTFEGSGVLLVGAPGERVSYMQNVGFVYVYRFPLVQNEGSFAFTYSGMKLYAEDARPNGFFGSAMAMDGARIVVGSPGPDSYPAGFPTIDDGGAAYVFDLVSGEQLAQLQPRDEYYQPLLGCYRFGVTVAIARGIVAVGAPKSKMPCVRATKHGSVFTFSMPDDGIGLKASESPWWWGQGPTYHQIGFLNPSEFDFQIEFGFSIALQKNVWSSGPEQSILAIGAPGAGTYGGIYFAGPFNASSPSHSGIEGPLRRFIAPAYLQRARFGHSISVDPASGLALIGAPSAFTSHGTSGAAVRSWVVRDAFNTAPDPSIGAQANVTTSLPLQTIEEFLYWGPDAEPGDFHGSSVAIGSTGFSLCGATGRTGTSDNGTALPGSGAAYMYLPIVPSPVAPPTPPPPPWTPDHGPPLHPPSPPPPAPPPDLAPLIGASTGGGFALLIILGYCLYRCCRPKPKIIISADTGRGPIASQIRGILADFGFKKTPGDLFKKWDKDGGGSVSRKEFRDWWGNVGYDVPVDDLNNLFDEFDIDGSGEIDTDEFAELFDAKGQLWQEMAAIQKEHDEDEDLGRIVDEMRKTLARKQKQLEIEQSGLQSLSDSKSEKDDLIAQIDEELAAFNQELAERKARLNKFKLGIKKQMTAKIAIRAFGFTPDEAAASIQAHVRGKSQRKLVSNMKFGSRPQSQQATRSRATPAPPRRAGTMPSGKMLVHKDGAVLGGGK